MPAKKKTAPKKKTAKKAVKKVSVKKAAKKATKKVAKKAVKKTKAVAKVPKAKTVTREQIQSKSFEIYLSRQKSGAAGDAASDWAEAERLLSS